MNDLETHAICSIINKIYSNKRMAPNNKWKILTPLKIFVGIHDKFDPLQDMYVSSYYLIRFREAIVWGSAKVKRNQITYHCKFTHVA